MTRVSLRRKRSRSGYSTVVGNSIANDSQALLRDRFLVAESGQTVEGVGKNAAVSERSLPSFCDLLEKTSPAGYKTYCGLRRLCRRVVASSLWVHGPHLLRTLRAYARSPQEQRSGLQGSLGVGAPKTLRVRQAPHWIMAYRICVMMMRKKRNRPESGGSDKIRCSWRRRRSREDDQRRLLRSRSGSVARGCTRASFNESQLDEICQVS